MSALKIWAKIKNSQPWENPNVRYRTILRVFKKNVSDQSVFFYYLSVKLEKSQVKYENRCVIYDDLLKLKVNDLISNDSK